MPKLPAITPPLLNSASPWATTLEDLLALYLSPHTGAVTTRTTLLNGFPHDNAVHKYAFFDPQSHASSTSSDSKSDTQADQTSSINNLGYSPIKLDMYLSWISEISQLTSSNPSLRRDKLFIISVTGTPADVASCYGKIVALQAQVCMPLAMEINLSCPNIPDKPPPAYSRESLIEYLVSLPEVTRDGEGHVAVGLKLPPYTYADQFRTLMQVLTSQACAGRITFLTSTNTLGTSLLISPTTKIDSAQVSSSLSLPAFISTLAPTTPATESDSTALTGLGGLAGSSLHPLALGNVYSLHHHLQQHQLHNHIQIIGVGGVEDADGYWRMRAAGAQAVAVATGFGRWGIGVFERISGS